MTAALAIVGWIDLVATVVLAGGVLFGALVAHPSQRGCRAMVAAAGTLAVALIASFALVAAAMHPLAVRHGPAFLLDVLSTRWGVLWIVRCLGLGVVARALAREPARWRALAVLCVPWLVARSFQSHAGAHGTMAALVDGAHIVLATAWLGALAQLALTPGGALRRVAARVRTLATTAVAIVLPSGVYGALLHVTELRQLVRTPYGVTLTVKVASATLLIALGAVNHFRHVPALEEDARQGVELGRTVRLELLVAAALLLLTAILGVLPLPHA